MKKKRIDADKAPLNRFLKWFYFNSDFSEVK